MKYLKLFEKNENDGWWLVFDPQGGGEINPNQWNGVDSYLRDKDIVDLSKNDVKRILDFLSPYVPLSHISISKVDTHGDEIKIDTPHRYRHSKNETYDNIEIVKLDDDYFIVSASYNYSFGIRSVCFKCDQMEGLLSLLSMMFSKFTKVDYSEVNYRTEIKRMLDIDVDKIDKGRLKILEDFLKEWRNGN